MKPSISVEHISKCYNIALSGAVGQTNFRDELTHLAKKLFLIESGSAMHEEEFWALADVSFEVAEGEAVGIIGPNGSGKSTLLKILARVVQPTSGQAVLRGRVGSILEVGTGFHSELTGRENIYMSGAVLGMRQREVRKRFDEIVNFSGVEKFLDVPVKKYSSGMQVRLAFSVAAHLDPEILLIDEVLAVGDVDFQARCIEKMRASLAEGTTLLFVSHNIPSVKAVCARGIVIQSGRIALDAEAAKAGDFYLGHCSG